MTQICGQSMLPYHRVISLYSSVRLNGALLVLISCTGIGFSSYLTVSTMSVFLIFFIYLKNVGVLNYRVFAKYLFIGIPFLAMVSVVDIIKSAELAHYMVRWAFVIQLFTLSYFYNLVTPHVLSKSVVFALSCIVIILISECIVRNFTSYPFLDSLYVDRQSYEVIAAGVFYRSRGFTGESGNIAAFIVVFLSMYLAINYNNKNASVGTVCALAFVGILLTLSTAGALVFLILILLYGTTGKFRSLIFTCSFVLGAIAAPLFLVDGLFELAYNIFGSKLTLLNAGASSSSDRVDNFGLALEVLSYNPFGVGSGNFSDGKGGNGILNIFLRFAVENGLTLLVISSGSLVLIMVRSIRSAFLFLPLLFFGFATGNFYSPTFGLLISGLLSLRGAQFNEK